MKTLVIQAHSTEDFDKNPTCAVVNSEIMKKVNDLAALCRKHDLTEVRVVGTPDLWLPAGIDEELRLQAHELVVSKDMFWFTAQPKNAYGSIDTFPCEITSITESINKANPGALIFMGEDEADLEEAYSEAFA